jgi:nitrate reductase beta subunit
MFGPGVDHAVDAYTRPSRELLAVLQLFRATQQIIFRFDIEPGPRIGEIVLGDETTELFNDTVVGFDASGTEVVRVRVEEPVIERPGKINSI